MEDSLINFETAKLAKEKGFNILTEKMYRQDGILGNSDFSRESTFRAPTQSLLQKWLREVYSIHLEVNVNILREWYFTGYDLSESRCAEIVELYKAGEDLTAVSYEEALEIGLQEAFKLIK